MVMNFFFSINFFSIVFLQISLFFILISTAVSNVAIIIAILLGLFSIFKEKNYLEIFYTNKMNLFISILTLLLILSYFYTSATDQEYIEVIKKYIKFLYIPVCYFIFKDSLKNQDFYFSFILGSSIILLLSYLKFFELIDPAKISEYFGLQYNPKLEKGVVVFQHSIIHGVVFSFYSFLNFYRARLKSNYIYYILSFLGFFNVLFLNNSRTAYLIVIVMFCIIIFSFLKSKDYIKFFSFITIVAILLSFFSNNVLSNRINLVINDIKYINKNDFESSIGFRYLWLKHGLNVLKKKPVLGYGAGSFKSTMYESLKKENLLYKKDLLTQNPHNEFVSIIAQTGLIGFLLLLGFFYYFFKYLKESDIGLAVFFLVFISCFFNSVFFDNMLGIFSIILISHAMSQKELEI